MSAATIGIEGALSALHRGAGEMSLRIWMEANQEALLNAWEGRRLDWEALCSWFAEVGLTNANGQVASVVCAKRIWHRAGKTLQQRRKREEDASIAKASKRDALIAQRAREAEVRQEAAEARANAERELEIRQIAERGFPPEPPATLSGPPMSPIATTPKQTTSDVRKDRESGDVVIGQIKRPVTMLKAAPRYGEDRFKPQPPSYVGPRPAGMPDNLPLEALTPLDASGLTSNGESDFDNMPGLPRLSFFERQSDWARACVPIIEALPREDRTFAVKLMLPLVKGLARNL